MLTPPPSSVDSDTSPTSTSVSAALTSNAVKPDLKKVAWEKAERMFASMTAAQRQEKETALLQNPAYSQLQTGDDVSILKRFLASTMHSVLIEQAEMAENHSRQVPANDKAAQTSASTQPTSSGIPRQPLFPKQTPKSSATPSKQPSSVAASFSRPVLPRPQILQPGAKQHATARFAQPQEQQARVEVARYIQSGGANRAARLCNHHVTQLHELQLWESAPDKSTFKPTEPCTPAVFNESITRETALMPMCAGCSLRAGAITPVGKGPKGEIVFQKQIVDTCTCGTSIFNGDCWMCETGRIEAAKRLAIMQREIGSHNGDPAAAAVSSVLRCACGQQLMSPGLARRCAGCGGIQTAPYRNFYGQGVIFHDGSAAMMELRDAFTDMPLPSAAGTAAQASFRSSGQHLPPEDIANTKKRKANQTSSSAAPALKRTSQQPVNLRRNAIQRPPSGHVLLFADTPENENAATALAKMGLRIDLTSCPREALSPTLRVRKLLDSNKDFVFDNRSCQLAKVLVCCGFSAEEAMSLYRPVWDQSGPAARVDQVLDVMGRIDWPNCLGRCV
ncbi:hypothetical protein KC340_g5861 [Hortaea werneckii]|nr:hypothetical protein KC342_g4362 [Hortaea werneckii]KAI7102008.1 hypothetical protein KC339_g6305 [Hortaea werneckii]KAI7219147.1 hypothetical protein KC365_g12404 [Hortaea werneckii]KAI7326535.1 hypothetical protein KC340_g5861 [Hortaea werneckii]KAI7387982.1 hypothetical protein KC328_g9179 [Hortaea werneckii]